MRFNFTISQKLNTINKYLYTIRTSEIAQSITAIIYACNLCLLMTLVAGCDHTNKQAESNTTSSKSRISKDSIKFASKIKSLIQYPLEVQHTSQFEFESDTMFVIIKGEKLLITPKGKLYHHNKKLFFDLKIKSNDFIEDLYIYPINNDLVCFYSIADGDNGISEAKRIAPLQKKIIWATNIYAFNMSRPVIFGDNAYLSTIGFIGKLNINTGGYEWKFENLYQQGKYNDFDEPIFLDNGNILFLSENLIKKSYDSILVDDKRGKILRKN
ncbi:MAG: hypothetical protein Q8862_09840 [Bacteroidota bacterium]|nr:hypothetical protein [Bacteroidota bacterium]MDP4205361.1 hypothetical protein [Bacteroidota bacterium]